MRLRTFTAANMSEAMRLVRAGLGDDAVILSTRGAENGRGVEITAAAGDRPAEARPREEVAEAKPRHGEALARALAWHGVPEPLAGRLAAAAAAGTDAEPPELLAGALGRYLEFEPLPLEPARPLVFVGPPGAGKTTLVARLATQAVLGRRRPTVATTDNQRAGATAQLEAFTRLLDVPLLTVDDPRRLGRISGGRRGGPVLLDTAGSNAYVADQLEALNALVRAIDGEPVLVLPAGTDPAEAADLGEAYRRIGCRRMVATRLDAARRLGGLLGAALGGDLALAAVTVSASVADAPEPIDAAGLARVLLRDTMPAQRAPAASLQEGTSR